MKKIIQNAAVLLLLAVFNLQLSTARAQNTTFTYQGRMLDNGSAFTGTGQFQFALVYPFPNAQAGAIAFMGGTPPNMYVQSFNVGPAGSGYVTVPTVTITGGGGSGASATASISLGMVSGLNLINPGSGYTSAPTVTIAPPPAFTYQSFWSNDGTSVNGSEPTTNVTVAVTNGLFTVVLGDTTISNMAAIPVSVFNQPNLQLQIWFNDGTHGFAALNPPQLLTPTPYAVYALNAANANYATAAGSANTAINATTATTAKSVAATNIAGIIPAAELPANVLTNGATGVNITGTFSGNGAGVTNVTLGSLGTGGAVSWGGFVLASSPGGGSGPNSVVAADVNGDGWLDLICANDNISGTLTVLTNNGSGGFGSNATLNVGSYPVSVVAADVNGDGWLDLICANDNISGTLTVLTNNGYGVFGSNATLNVGNDPFGVIAADVNGDGRLDLICANFGSNTLTVLTNNGSGGFGFNATLNVGRGPSCVIAADVNGDGKVDLISANASDNTLSVLTNNGYGVFGSNATLNVGNNPVGVIAADVNGDGRLDLICANYNISGTLTVLTNNGSGGFGFNATLNVGRGPSCVIAADVNGDGRLDLICANVNASGTLTVLTNSGSGGFGSNATLNVGKYPVSVVAADVNGDGQPDLICANLGDSTLSVLFNTPTFNGNFSGNSTGSFSGNGGGLTNVTAATVAIPQGMALIPAGSFTMGDNLDGESDAIPTNIYVSQFYIDINLVSLSQWKSVYYWAKNQAGYGFADAGAGKAANNPVQTVDWFDCVKWCNARSQQAGRTPVYYTDAGYTHIYTNLESYTVYVNPAANGYRLPTEAEWEKAARGGLSGQRFPWGNNIDESLANYYGATASYTYDLGPNGYNAVGSVGGTSPATSPVGSFAPNGYGLFDMAGNVDEWCGDWYGTPYGQPTATNPTGPATGSGRVLRGGYWSSDAAFSRCAYRLNDYPLSASVYFGFRCVRGL